MFEQAHDNTSPHSQTYPLTCEYAHGGPLVKGMLRSQPADFQVDEVLGFELSGEGEHHFLQIRKTGLNTADLVKRIAALAGVKAMDVGYAGLKDRHAVTTQWFSVYLPGHAERPWQALDSDDVQVLAINRHRQKLRRGQHAANQFRIRLRDCSGQFAALDERMALIAQQGVPNYFGPQRFGFGGGNLQGAERLLVAKKPVHNRQLKGLYLSAARSYIFNQVLRARIKDVSWQQFETGDVGCAEVTPDMTDVPSGPLWGRGRLASRERIGALETQIAENHAGWCHGLEHAGLKQERRPLCLPVANLNWSLNPENNQTHIEIAFSLPVGGYATSVIREFVEYQEPDRSKKTLASAGEEAHQQGGVA